MSWKGPSGSQRKSLSENDASESGTEMDEHAAIIAKADAIRREADIKVMQARRRLTVVSRKYKFSVDANDVR